MNMNGENPIKDDEWAAASISFLLGHTSLVCLLSLHKWATCALENFWLFRMFSLHRLDPVHCILFLQSPLCLQQQCYPANLCGRARQCSSLGKRRTKKLLPVWIVAVSPLSRDQLPCGPLNQVKGDVTWMENTRMNYHSSFQLLCIGKHTTF